MALSINRKLNLVVPIETDAGEIYVHSTPVSHNIFMQFYEVIAKTFAKLYGGGYGITAGPRIAAMLMKTTAEEMGAWASVEMGLVNEIRRLSAVILPGDRGWVTLPYDDAVRLGSLSEEDAAQVDNVLAFFIVASAMHSRKDLPGILLGASKLWGGSTTSLTYTEYAAGLVTSTDPVSSGASVKKTLSSIPS